VCGIANEKIQSKLLSEKSLTYQTAMSLAQSMEIAERNVKELQRVTTMEQTVSGVDKSVNKVEESKPKNQARPCYRCGKDGHAPTVCRFKEVTCYNCGKLGHLKAVCRKERKGSSCQGGKQSLL